MFNATLTIPTFSMSLGDVNVFCSIRPHILIDHAKVCIKNYPSRLMFLIPLFCVCVSLLCNRKIVHNQRSQSLKKYNMPYLILRPVCRNM